MKSLYFERKVPKVLATKFAAKYCKSLLYTSVNAVRLNVSIPDPALPAPNWVRVRNVACGVCGTDLNFFKSYTGTQIALEPMPGTDKTFLGHENVGIIEEIGADAGDFKVGDRVMIREYMAGCGNRDLKDKCRFCAEGNYSICENYGEINPEVPEFTGAGFGDSFIAPRQQLAKIQDGISDDRALLIEPAAVSLHAVLRHPPKPGEKVMVLGCGTIGLGVVQWLKIIEPKCIVYAMERIKSKQEFAMKLGADKIVEGNPYDYIAKETNGKVYTGMFGNTMLMGGFDVIYDCVGTGGTVENCLRWLRARGTLVKVGTRLQPISFDETPLWWQELTIVGVDSHGMEEYNGEKIYTVDLVQKFMLEGKYVTDGFISHRFPLSEYKKAFKIMVDNPPDHIKTVIDCK